MAWEKFIQNPVRHHTKPEAKPKPKPEPTREEQTTEEAPPPPQQQQRVKAAAQAVNPFMSHILTSFSENTIDKDKKGL